MKTRTIIIEVTEKELKELLKIKERFKLSWKAMLFHIVLNRK